MTAAPEGPGSQTPTEDDVIDAALSASRVMIAIASRSLAAAGEDVTLTQYRALVVLAYNGPHRTGDLANVLGVNSSTATRLIDRLVRRHLVHRTTHPNDRRATRVEISEQGRSVVAAVTGRRRTEFARILGKLDEDVQRKLVDSLEAMTAAAGEAPEQSWTLGWGS